MTTYQEAYDHLIQNIFAPVFFEKLAKDYGLRPTTEAEFNELLVLSGKLEQLEREHQTKQASDRTSVVSSASQALDHLAGKAPANSPNAYSVNEIKQAASELTQVDTIRNAALLFADYMRQVNS